MDFFVDELLDFWDGVWIDIFVIGFKFCWFVLVCVICDIFVFCKLCGFLSFSVILGCNECKKLFLRLVFVEKYDFFGFNWDSWILCIDVEYRE